MLNDKYKLTIPQKNIWMVENFYNNKNVNIVSGTLAIKQEFNIDIAKKVVNKFIELNEATRIRVTIENNNVFQYIEEYKPINVKVIDISELSETEIINTKQDFLDKNINTKGNLFELIILDKKNGYGEFFLKAHHLVSDAWSVSKMGTDLVSLYEKISNNELDFEKQPSYIDFIHSEEEYQKSDKFNKDKIFWNEYLKDCPETTNLKSKEYNDVNAKRFNKKISKEICEKIDNFCKKNRLSEYAVFLTAIAIYIHRVTQNNDFNIGTPVLNRANYKEKQMQGMFVNTLPVRFNVDDNDTFFEICKKTSFNSMQIFKHQKYSYEEMIKETRKDNNCKKNLFSVAFSYQNARSNIELDKYEIEWIFNNTIQEQLEIHISDLNNSGCLEFDIDYLTELFEDKEIEYISDRIITIILEGIKKNSTVCDMEIMSKQEKDMILKEINNTKKQYDKNKTVLDCFAEQVKLNPKNVALVLDNEKMTYKELDEKSDIIACLLKEKDIKQGDTVGICIDKSFELLVAIIGVLKVGAIYVPIDNNYNLERKKHIISQSRANMILCDIKQDIDVKQIKIKGIDFSPNVEKAKTINTNSSSPVCILFTSGTTGKPKAVEIINRNIIKLVKNIDYMDFTKEDRILQVASTVFDLSIFEFWASLLNGNSLCLIKKDDLLNFNYLKQYIDKEKITIMCLTSVLFNQMVAEKINIFENMRQILIGGDKLSIDHIRKLKQKYNDIKLYNSYGPTETTSFCNMYEIKDVNKKVIPIGKPITNSVGYVIDNKNRLLPFEVEGEYAIGGEGVSNGYINDEKLLNEKFISNKFTDSFTSKKIYKTGDIVKLNIDGNIEFIGRKDNQVKIRGYRIELEEIKRVVLSFEHIKDCAILIKENNKNLTDKSIVLYIVSDEKINISVFTKYLRNNLQSYMIPVGIMQISQIPMTTNYKLDVSKLPEIKQDRKRTVEPLTTKSQKKLAKIIYKVLEKEVGLDDNLFTEGLDSLNAISLSIEISEKFNKDISTKDVMENSTIRELEMFLEKAKSEKINEPYLIEQNITSGEKSIYLEWLKNPETTLYNAPFELKFKKNINVEKLKKAILKTISNNSNMFSSFNIVDNEIIKIINSNTSYKIQTKIITEKMYTEIRESFTKPFNLSVAPLFKIEIYITEENVYALFDIHHIIFDGSSFAIFMEEIMNRYKGKKIQNRNIKMNHEISEEKFEKARQYFLEMFEGELPINDLPYDRQRPLIRSLKGDNLATQINKNETEKIYKYIKENGITLNSLCQSVYSILMSKYTYSDDIIIGTAISGRNETNESSIGMNVKTVPYRTIIDWKQKVLEYIKDTQFKMISLIENGSIYTYENLIKDLDIKRDESRNLLFDSMFVCQNIHLAKLAFDGIIADFSGLNRTTSKFDLTFEVVPQNDKIQLNVEYATDLFNQDTIKDLVKHYIHILKNIMDNKDMLLYDIEMILPEEKDEIINNFNNTKTKYPNKTVHQIFEEQAKKHPNKKAIVFEDNSLTYKELNEKANQLARLFIKKGLNSGDVASIMIDKSLEYLPVAIAVLKCGAAYTPIIRDLPDERAKYMIENAKSKIIITNKKFYRKISDINTIFIDDEKIYNKNSKDNLNLKCNIDDMLHIIYTSGSTGLPKGNMIKHRGMVRLLLNTNYLDYSENDVMLASTSLTFDLSGFEIWGAMFYGMTLHMITKEQLLDINYYSNYLEENKITTTFLATPIFHLLIEENVDMFKKLKTLFIAGEALLPRYSNIIFNKCKTVKAFNAYGPAEATVFCTIKLIDKEYKTNEDVPIGKVSSNNTIVVLDKCDKLCPANVPGELYVSGDGLCNGYINREDLTKEKFVHIHPINDTAYKSGDLTKWNKNGELRFIGRIDNQIKIRGQRIELSEIQNKILELPEVKETALIVKTINEKNKYIIGYYSQNEEIKPNVIKDYLKKYLPVYMIPYKLVAIDKMPYNQNGKIDRKKLPDVKINENVKLLEPSNADQEKILNVFKDTLELDEIGMNSDFFENGGDSLEVSKLVANFQSTDIEITYADIFKYKTPMEVYEFLYLKKKKDRDFSDINEFDYSKINELLSKNIFNNDMKIKTSFKEKNILLTGVTGFLGVHILKELVDNEKVKKIYCLVREKDNLSTEARFKKQLNFFFEKKIVDKILTKSKVIKGDITNSNLVEDELNENIDIVINSAAYVKHYGNYEKFYKINVQGVENIIDFCIKSGSQLMQMSTLSVSGNILEQGQIIQDSIKDNTIFDETRLYINQNLENVYVNTKYLAELKILNAIIDKGLNAKIIRLGNLTGRFEDGKFQPNVEDNAFANRIKALTTLKTISKEMYDKYIEMTPIDIVSRAINKILLLENKNFIVFHLYNDKHIEMPFILDIFNEQGFEIKVKSSKEMGEIIKQFMQDKDKTNLIKGIIPDVDKNGELKYNDTTIIKSEFTKAILKKLGFEWVDISKEYLVKYFEYLEKINFINLDNGGKND